MYYDTSTNQHTNLSLTGTTQYIWSPSGQLAVLVQGEYGGKTGFWQFPPSARATTEGFNYLLYLINLKNRQTALLDNEIFGDVFWNKDSSGLYISEHYLSGSKLLLGNQSGSEPTEIKTYFLPLTARKKIPVTRREFDLEKSTIVPPLPNRNFTATETNIDYQKWFISITDSSGKELTKFEGRDPSWQPQTNPNLSQPYTFPDYGFQISMPSDWESMIDEGSFVSPNGDYQFLVKIKSTPHKTIETFLAELDKDPQTSLEGQPNIQIISTQNIRYNKLKGVKRRELWFWDDFAKPVIKTYFLSQGKIYSLQLRYHGTNPNPDPAGESDYNSILSSFQFTNE